MTDPIKLNPFESPKILTTLDSDLPLSTRNRWSVLSWRTLFVVMLGAIIGFLARYLWVIGILALLMLNVLLLVPMRDEKRKNPDFRTVLCGVIFGANLPTVIMMTMDAYYYDSGARSRDLASVVPWVWGVMLGYPLLASHLINSHTRKRTQQKPDAG